MKFKLLLLSLIVMLILSYFPLNYAAYIESDYEDPYSFFFRSNLVDLDGDVQSKDGGLIIGNVNYENNSVAELSSIIHVFPFMNLPMKNSMSSFLIIDGDYPITTVPYSFEETDIGWNDYNFVLGWEQITKDLNFSVVDGVLNISHSFIQGERKNAMLKIDDLSINSTRYPHMVIRWKSTDHVTTTIAYSETEDYKVIVEVYDMVHQRPATDYGGAYSPDWKTTIFRFPPNRTINRIELGMDTGNWPSVSGKQETYFDYVMFAKGNITGSTINLELNGQTILNELLISSIGDVNSVDKTSYPTSEIRIPIDFKLLELNNLLKINVSHHTSWNISSATIYLKSEDLSSPLWKSIPNFMPILFIILTLESAIIVLMIHKLYKWIISYSYKEVNTNKSRSQKLLKETKTT